MQTTKDGGLFQSPLWKEFQAFQKKTLFTGEEFFGVEEVIPGIGRSGYVPRGPLSVTRKTIQDLQKIGVEHNFVFLRVEPQSREEVELLRKEILLKKAPIDVQPKEFLLMSISNDEDTLLGSMKPKWRYNIRLAQKNEVAVMVARKEEERIFLSLLKATAERKNISFHSTSYYEDFIDFFSQYEGALLVAKKGEIVLAGAMMVYWQGTAYYVHGGSSNEGKNLMAPHLLQWEAIRRAKAKGCVQYDFGGVAIQEKAPQGKDWQGITRFKQGFAPNTQSTVLPGAYDIILSPVRYGFYKALLAVRRMVKNII